MAEQGPPGSLYPSAYHRPELQLRPLTPPSARRPGDIPADQTSIRLPPLLSEGPLRPPANAISSTRSHGVGIQETTQNSLPALRSLQESVPLSSTAVERDGPAASADRRTPVSQSAFYGHNKGTITASGSRSVNRDPGRRRSSAATIVGSSQYERIDVSPQLDAGPSTSDRRLSNEHLRYPDDGTSRRRWRESVDERYPTHAGGGRPPSVPSASAAYYGPSPASLVVPLGRALQQYSVPCVISEDGTSFIPVITPQRAFGHAGPPGVSIPVFDGINGHDRSSELHTSRNSVRDAIPGFEGPQSAINSRLDQYDARTLSRSRWQYPGQEDGVHQPTSGDRESSSSANGAKRLTLTLSRGPSSAEAVAERKRRLEEEAYLHSSVHPSVMAAQLASTSEPRHQGSEAARPRKKFRQTRESPDEPVPAGFAVAPPKRISANGRRIGRPPRPKPLDSEAKARKPKKRTVPVTTADSSQAVPAPKRQRKKRWYAHRARALSTTPVLSDEVERRLRSETTYPLCHERSTESEWVQLDDLLGPEYWHHMKGPVAERLQEMHRQDKGKQPTSAAPDREAHLPDYHAQPSKIPGSGKYIMDPMLARVAGGDETSQTGSVADADASSDEGTSGSDESGDESDDESGESQEEDGLMSYDSEASDAPPTAVASTSTGAKQLKLRLGSSKPPAAVPKKRSRPGSNPDGTANSASDSTDGRLKAWQRIPREELLARMAKVRAARGAHKQGVSSRGGRGGTTATSSRGRGRGRGRGTSRGTVRGTSRGRGRGRGRGPGRPPKTVTAEGRENSSQLPASSLASAPPVTSLETAKPVQMDDFHSMTAGANLQPLSPFDQSIGNESRAASATLDPSQPTLPKPKRMPKGYVIVTDDEDDKPPPSPALNLDGSRSTRRSAMAQA